MIRGLVALAAAVAAIAHVGADCGTPKASETAFIIDTCELVVPERVPTLKAFAEHYPEGSVESGRAEAARRAARVLDSYRGVILVSRGNQTSARLFVPSKDRNPCSTFKKGETIRALVDHACCDGDPNVPCYLGFNAYVAKLLPK